MKHGGERKPSRHAESRKSLRAPQSPEARLSKARPHNESVQYMPMPCEDRIGTGPPRARTEVICVDLGRFDEFGSWFVQKNPFNKGGVRRGGTRIDGSFILFFIQRLVFLSPKLNVIVSEFTPTLLKRNSRENFELQREKIAFSTDRNQYDHHVFPLVKAM